MFTEPYLLVKNSKINQPILRNTAYERTELNSHNYDLKNWFSPPLHSYYALYGKYIILWDSNNLGALSFQCWYPEFLTIKNNFKKLITTNGNWVNTMKNTNYTKRMRDYNYLWNAMQTNHTRKLTCSHSSQFPPCTMIHVKPAQKIYSNIFIMNTPKSLP